MSISKVRKPKNLSIVSHNYGLEEIKTYALGLEAMVNSKPRPHSLELEEAVLGALIMNKKAFSRVLFLRDFHFYKSQHAVLFSAMKSLVDRQEPIDLLTLTNELKHTYTWPRHWSHDLSNIPDGSNALEMIGGTPFIIELTNRVASDANIEYHARIILQKFCARELIMLSMDAIKNAYTEQEDIFDLRLRISKEVMVAPLNSFFDVRRMDQVYADADSMPEMVRLCGDLVRLNELVFMFAPPGVGKSILAVQIGRALALGEDVMDGILINELKRPMKVGFVDMELFDNEITRRYTSDHDKNVKVNFGENFIRISPNRGFIMKGSQDLETVIRNHLEAIIDTEKIELLIVDNITALTGQTASDVNVATDLMRWLTQIRAQKNLTILVLGHTTKYLNKSLPMEQQDMKGAGALTDFAPTVFGLRECPAIPGSLYIKMVKGRNGKTYNASNTIVMTSTRENDLYLRFNFDKFSNEEELLSSFVEHEVQDEMILAAVKMKCENPQTGLREIVKELGLPWSHTTLGNRMKEYCAGSKQYEFIQGGMIKKNEVDFLGEEIIEKKDDTELLNNQRKENVPF